MERAVGIFASRAAAETARVHLAASGVALERMVVSAGLTDDAIAAEAPGEAYQNQELREDPHDEGRAQYAEQVRAGACTLSVAAGSAHELERVERLLRDEGAHIVTHAP